MLLLIYTFTLPSPLFFFKRSGSWVGFRKDIYNQNQLDELGLKILDRSGEVGEGTNYVLIGSIGSNDKNDIKNYSRNNPGPTV